MSDTSNYFKILAGGRVVAIEFFDAKSEPSAYSAWLKALESKRRAKDPDGRRIVLGAPMSIRGPWDSIATTYYSGLAKAVVA